MRCPSGRGVASVLLTCLWLSPPAPAFTQSLSSESIRDAYFLGQRNDEKTAAFLNRYDRTFPMPPSGLYVSDVELFTPYAELVDLSRQHTAGYSAQQAEKEYHQRGSVLRLRVRVYFDEAYPENTYAQSSAEGNTPDAGDYEPGAEPESVHVVLRQNGAIVPAMRTPGVPTYRISYIYNEEDVFCGFDIILHYRARNVASDDAEILVSTPDGQRISATFDLTSLR